eukprot:g13313.t1
MTRLSGVVVLLCNYVARAAGLPGSSTDSRLPRGSHETPYPSDADAFGLPMDGAAGFPGSYARLPWDTETSANTRPGTSTSTGPLDFLAKSPEVAPHAGDQPTALRAGTEGHRVFDGLEVWLRYVKLEHYLTAANTWCHENGAVDYTEIFKDWAILSAFCRDLGMNPDERRQIVSFLELERLYLILERQI